MSIHVALGTNNSDNRYLVKDVDWKEGSTNIACDVYNPTDRINPVILLDKEKVKLDNINYMRIPEFGRYYFITAIVGASGNRVEVHGHVDVLMTYAEQIKRCSVIAARSTNKPNMYLHDDMRLNNVYLYNQYVNIGDDLGQPNIIYLMTLGDTN